MPRELHIYQCWACKSTLTVAVKTTGTGAAYRCYGDHTPMTFLYTRPVETEEDRILAARVPAFSFAGERPVTPYRKRPCSECRQHVEQEHLIELSGVGKFCSTACADAGAAKHDAFMQRVAKVKHDMPWLDTAQKESA